LTVETDPSASWALERRALLERHPRASWAEQSSPTVQLWLEVHDGFRRDCVALAMAGDDYSGGRLPARDLAVLAGARLRGLVAQLRGHHEIEDHHYFPTFRDAAPRLAPAFDLLAADHMALEKDVGAALAALGELVAAADGHDGAPPAAEHAARRYVAAGDRLCRRLASHLSDEEDLIIPLLIQRGA